MLKQEDAHLQSEEWYNDLRETLLSESTERHAFFRKILGYNVTDVAAPRTE